MTINSFTRSAATATATATASAPNTRTARRSDTTSAVAAAARQTALSTHLHAELLALPFAAFARCVADLLDALGYADVQLAGRLDWRGRNKDGGYDLSAWVPSGLAPQRRVIVQVKQFGPDLLVHQRNVDELRGACLRTGAAEGLLVTTSGFSRVVQDQQDQQAAVMAAQAAVPLAPVHLVDGPALTRALALHRIGVKENGQHGTVLDQAYFARLTAQAGTDQGNGRSGGRGTRRPAPAPVREPSNEAFDSQPWQEFGATLTLRLDFAPAAPVVPVVDFDPAPPAQNSRNTRSTGLR